MKKPCDSCGGSGQIHFFAGVSRFHLSCEECPDCAGFGFELPVDENISEKKQASLPAKKCSPRKKGK